MTSEIKVNGKAVDYSKAPSNCAGGLQLYIEHGIMPGSFLTAFLSNDLMEAMGRADDTNQRQFKEIATWLYNYAPTACYGSPKKVRDYVHARRQATIGA